MCIFCGGQCGGVGELLISLGLPFLAIYFMRLKAFLGRMKKKILGQPMPESANTSCECCGDLQSAGSQGLSPMLSEVRLDQPLELSLATTSQTVDEPATSRPEGVRGWLLLLCINLIILIPALNLYQTICMTNMLVHPQYRILLALWSKSYYYLNIAMIFIMIFIAVYSFYSGWQLWTIKEGAVKTAKSFLIVQLSLALVTLALQQLMDSQSAGNAFIFAPIMGQALAPVLYFSVWYFYLMKSPRVHKTYSQAEGKPLAQYAPA